MAFINVVDEYLNNNEFSLEMLNYCRMCFQYGGFNETDCIYFKEMLSKKIRTCLPELNPKADEVIAQLCIDRGILEIQDIIFVDGAIFSEIKGEASDDSTYINFIGSTTTFTQSTFDFLSQALNIKQVDKKISNRLAKNMHEIFEKYFDNPNFPIILDWEEIINWPSIPLITFTLSCDENKLALSCKENEDLTFKIVTNISGTPNYHALELHYSADKEKPLEVVSNETKVEVVRLSSILSNKKVNEKIILKK